MAVDRSLDVMAAIRSALIGDGSIAALIGTRCYDVAPEKTAAPYLTLGGGGGYTDSSTSDSEAQDIEIDVHCWDIPADRANAKNTANVHNLMAHVRRVLHATALSVSGRNVIVCRVIRAISVVADADSIHGVVIVRVLTGHE